MDELLVLALEDPVSAQKQAQALLAGPLGDHARSYALQCLGIALRESGRTGEALVHLRRALRAAVDTGATDRVCDVRATYGTTLVVAGRPTEGLAQLDLALDAAVGGVAAKVAMRKAAALAILGRYDAAAPVVRTALSGMVGSGDLVWEARTRIWLAHIEMSRGRLAAAEAEATREIGRAHV